MSTTPAGENRRWRARGAAGRGGAGRGAVFEKGCFGVGWGGGILCTYISPKGVCDGGVKNGGVNLGKKRPHLGKECEQWAKVL